MSVSLTLKRKGKVVVYKKFLRRAFIVGGFGLVFSGITEKSFAFDEGQREVPPPSLLPSPTQHTSLLGVDLPPRCGTKQWILCLGTGVITTAAVGCLGMGTYLTRSLHESNNLITDTCLLEPNGNCNALCRDAITMDDARWIVSGSVIATAGIMTALFVPLWFITYMKLRRSAARS